MIAMQPGTTKLACPNCHKDDMVQKVTAVVGSGVTATVLPGIANVVGAHQTLMSNLLLPPIRPKSEIEGGAGNMFVFVLLLLVGSPGLIARVVGITELRTGVSDASIL
jgi:hypothetical protein